ncbi:type VII secretion protein EccE [Aestuariimicrobium ganziense]|uniref:type VII secretion protein EccE n=1 Tax=Aestuariimicrobium ganziense TaxID=2773677 RepID=UPI0019446F38|nr:type VII secretion protein EccE [Aestuariimicrobium ganziense]
MPRPAPTTHRAPRRRGTLRGLTTALAWEFALVVIALVALLWRPTGLYLAGGLLVLLLVVGLPVVRGRSLLSLLASRWRFVRRRRARVTDPGDMPVDLVPLAQWVPGLQVNQTRSAQGHDVGVVTDGESWTAILALATDDALLSDSGERVDLDALKGLTRQDDIVFAGLQLVTYTVPAPVQALLRPDSVAAKAYLELSGGDVPPAVRRTWICVRLDPRLCLEAVARRGASNDGIYATLRFGLHRVQAALKRQGIITRALSPMEIYEVLSFTTGSTPDHAADRSSESWTTWSCDGLVHSGRQVRSWGDNTSLGYQSLLQTLDRTPVLFAVSSYTVDADSRVTGGVRLVTPTTAAAQQAQQHLSAALDRSVKLAAPGGAQVPAVLATVPLGRPVA